MSKAVLNRKKYDTEKAEEVASWSNHLGASDFNHCYETLYSTQNGSLFLCGAGGPMSKYRKSQGNGYTGSKGNITPLSKDSAIDWLEEKDKASVIENWFSEEIEEA